MGREIARVSEVSASGRGKLRVRFVADRRQYEVDLASALAHSKHFAPLLRDERTFRKAKIVDDGLGVAWAVDTNWGNLDLSATTLREIARKQRASSS
jgi:hypothetical protein